MDWPSERINQGSFLHTPKVTYSKETQNLMKILIEESRLTMLQRKKIQNHLRSGESLPNWQQNVNQKFCIKYSDRQYINHTKNSRRRTLDSILESDAFSIEKFISKDAYKETSEKAKIRLQEQMSGLNRDANIVKFKNINQDKPDYNGCFDAADEVIKEIEERIQWLDDMEKLGEAKKHRLVIQSQIQIKLDELKQLQQQKITKHQVRS